MTMVTGPQQSPRHGETPAKPVSSALAAFLVLHGCKTDHGTFLYPPIGCWVCASTCQGSESAPTASAPAANQQEKTKGMPPSR